MKKLFLIFSFVGCMTFMLQAQINKMYKTTTTPTTQTKTNNNVKIVSANSVVNNLVASYQGMINISPDINSKMQTEWQASAAQFGGNQLKAELWTVTYQQDPKNTNYTQIILQQRINTRNISYQALAGGISYSISSLPAENNLVIVLFCNSLKSVPGLIIKGKPDDGRVQTRQNLRLGYESDAKYKLGQNIIYGIYSIVPGKTDLNHIDFNFFMPGNTQSVSFIDDAVDDIKGVASKVIDGVTYCFDMVVDGITGLAKLVINGEADIIGFYINAAGEILFVEGNTVINLIYHGNLPRVRPMHQDEYDWANRQIFNGALPPIGMFKVFNFMQTGNHLFYTWPSPGGAFIYLNIGDAYDDPENYSVPSYPGAGQEFIHELAHAWQINKYGYVDMVTKYFADGGTGQDYNPNHASNTINGNFNLEQQATMVDRTFLKVYYGKGDSWSSSMQQQWVELNVRNGVKIDTFKMRAAKEMQTHANLPNIKPFIGSVRGDAVFSKGNKTDGSGYYMQGSVPGSFLYYDTLDKTPYANWGPIRKKYEAIGVEFGTLSWPIGDELSTPKKPGFYQYFKGGVIYYSVRSGAYYLSGSIFTKWKEQGYENGRLGFPISDPVTTGSGNGPKLVTTLRTSTTQTFEYGELFMQTTTTSFAANPESSAPVHVIFNNILMTWKPEFGFPSSDQVSVPEKRSSNFVLGQTIPAFDSVACQNANIYWNNSFGAHVVKGEILNAYRSLGASNSALGLPTGDQLKATGNANTNMNKLGVLPGHIDDCYQEFQGGTINYSGGKIDVQYKGNRILKTQNVIKVH